MKNEASIGDVVSQKVVDAAHAFLSFEDSNFVTQASYLKLDPSHDFRHADLAFVDFSNCDLRGFDFTGADLHGATGLAVRWDKTTVLNEADTTSSLFAYSLAKEKFFRANPEHEETVRRLAGDYWPNTVLGVEKLLQRDDAASVHIARAVFDEVESTAVRSQVLFFMRIAAGSAEEHKTFIYNTLARHGSDVGVILAAVRALGAFYLNDQDAFNVLTKLLSHGDRRLRQQALRAVLLSVHLHRRVGQVRAYVLSSGDSMMRRLYLGRVASFEGRKYVNAACDSDRKNFLDFDEPIPQRKLETMARDFLLEEKRAARTLAPGRRFDTAIINVDEGTVSRCADDFRRRLVHLGNVYKIPFEFKG